MIICRKISNAILIITFLIIITTPHILFSFLKDDIPVDNSENRKLAEKPVFKLENIGDYPSNYEDYYNDNFPFRSVIRNAWTNFNFFILNESTTSKVLVGKNDGEKSLTWLFYQDDTDKNPVKETQGLEVFSKDEMTEIAIAMDRNIKELQNRDIQLVYALIPNKENVYKEKLPDNITIFEEETRVDKLVKYIENETEISNILYLKDALIKAKQTNEVFYRQDTHWNNFGAFIGFKEIVKKIDNTYNNFDCDVQISEEKIFEQDLTKMSGIKDILKDNEITVSFYPDIEYAETIFETQNIIKVTTCENAPIDKTVMVVGDSFRAAMIPYFSKTYSKVIYLHRCEYGSYMLRDYEPDIIICQYLERYVDGLKDFNLY